MTFLGKTLFMQIAFAQSIIQPHNHKNVILHLLQICPNINMKLNKCVHGLDGKRIIIILKPCETAFQCRITLNIDTLEMRAQWHSGRVQSLHCPPHG